MSFTQIQNNAIAEYNTLINYLIITFLRFKEYPFNFVLGLFWPILNIIPTYFLWQYVFAGNQLTYTTTTIIFYYIFVISLSHNIYFFNYLRTEIRNGDYVKITVRPLKYSHHMIFNIISELLTFRMLAIIFVSLIGVYFFSYNALLGILFFLFGVVLAALLYSIVISLGFWTGESYGFTMLFGEAIYIISGNLIPLDLFPAWANKIFAYLPFQYMFYIPAKVYIADHTITSYTILLLAFWIISSYFLLRILIYYGLKRAEQLGG